MARKTQGRVYNNPEEARKFGDQIRRLRQERKMTLQALADEAGVELSTIYRIEKTKMVITLDLVFSLAKALGVEVRDLF